MTVNNRFTFEVAIGDKQVINKNTYNWRSVHYTTETMGIDDLIDKVKQGYPFNSVMSMPEYTAEEKTQPNFRQTSFVAFDFDDCPDCFEQAYNETDLVPTFAYTTPNDGKPNKGNRFRFVYAMSQPITSIPEYKAVYRNIASRFGLKVDNALLSGVQNIGGMSSTGRLKVSYKVYDKEDFLDNTTYNCDKNIYSKSAIKNNKEKKKRNGITLNCTFEKDLNELDFNQFLMKYRNKYEYFANTPLTFNNGYALIPDNYYEIKRKWVNDTYETSTGIKDIRTVYRLKDGDGRRDKMFVQCLIRRKIKPDITLEELVFNLACERQWYFNNDDNQLNNKELIRIATNAMNVEEITIPPTATGKKFIVDKAYWAERDINANQAKQMIKKMIKNEEIGNLYDPSLTDKENLAIFKQYNVECSKRTLATWKKENGLTRGYTKKNAADTNTATQPQQAKETITAPSLPQEVQDMFTDKLGKIGTKVPYKTLRTETVDTVLYLAGWIETMFGEDKAKVSEYKHALNDLFESIKQASLQHEYVRSQLDPSKNDDIDMAAEQITEIVEKAITDRFQSAREHKIAQRNAQRELARILSGAII